MDVYRTPEARFERLPGYDFEPHYTTVAGLRMHHAEAGPGTAGAGSAGPGETVLLLHGEPTWSYLYRTMIPVIAAAGHRVLAPDLPGFGRSDKPVRRDDYSYSGHVAWVEEWIRENGLSDITLVAQDWGSLIGLRLVGERPDLFRRVVIANGGLPTGEEKLGLVFRLWQAFARWTPVFPVRAIVRAGCARPVPRDVLAAYGAPHPTRRSKAGARAFPDLVPTRPDHPEAVANRQAWAALEEFRNPFLTAFGTGDPIFRGFDRVLQKRIPGAAGQEHRRLKGAGHFIQEDVGEELAGIIVEFIAATSTA
jgi:haloalkane dehalogenase